VVDASVNIVEVGSRSLALEGRDLLTGIEDAQGSAEIRRTMGYQLQNVTSRVTFCA